MKKLVSPLLIVVALLMPKSIFAYDFELDGIFYNILSNTEVEVTSNNEAIVYPYDENFGSYHNNVNIPETIKHDGMNYTVTAIGDSAFFACSYLNCVTIPYTVTRIGNYAFAFNSRYIIISNTDPLCITLGDAVFYNSNNCRLYVPSYLYYYYQEDTRWSENFDDIIAADFMYEGIDYRVISYDEIEVAQCNDKEIEEVIIPESIEYGDRTYYVTSIGDGAFSYCEALTNITIPEYVSSIGEEAFSYCKALTDITIPEYVTTIGDGAFMECTGLTDVTIPDYVTYLGNRAFRYCQGLTSITLGNSITFIGIETFYGCIGLTDIAIPNSVTQIGVDAFAGCKNLTSINIPNSVTSIGSYAFLRCNNLDNVTIGNSVMSIGEYAFDGCTHLTSLTIPKSVTSIGYRAFSSTSGLTSITVESGNPIYDSRDNCNAIIETSSNTLITGCMNSIIPNTVTAIGGAAFFNAPYHYVRIPASVSSIGLKAFAGCWVRSVTCLASIPPVADEELFYNGSTSSSAPLYVPFASISAYQNAVGWNFFHYVHGLGDVNGDNTLGVDDLAILIDILLLETQEQEQNASTDANGDGVVDIIDVAELIDMLLTSN